MNERLYLRCLDCQCTHTVYTPETQTELRELVQKHSTCAGCGGKRIVCLWWDYPSYKRNVKSLAWGNARNGKYDRTGRNKHRRRNTAI